MRARSIISLIVLSLGGFPGRTVPAARPLQAPGIVTQDKEEASRQGDEKRSPQSRPVIDRALDTIAYAAALIPNLPGPESQVAAYAALADALWRYDQGRARDFFRAAFTVLAKVEVDAASRNRQAEVESADREQWKYETRTQLLYRVAQLDEALAVELARLAPEEGEKSSIADGKASNSESIKFLLQRAFALLDTDPQQAADLARRTLSAGISPWLTMFLSGLRERAPALANDVFAQALNLMLAQSDPPDIASLQLLSPYLLDQSSQADLSLTRRFLMLVANGLQAQPMQSNSLGRRLSASEHYYLLRLYLPLFGQYLPEVVPSMQVMLSQLSAALPAEQRSRMSQGSSSSGTTSESGFAAGRVKEAEAGGTTLGGLGETGARGAAEEKPIGREPAIKKTGDERLREAALDAQRYELAQRALHQDRLDEASRVAREIKNPLARIELLVQIGMRMAKQGDTGGAAIHLDQAYGLITSLDDSRQKIIQILLLAQTTLWIDRDRAFTYAQGAVSVLNQLRGTNSSEKKPSSEWAGGWAYRGLLEGTFLRLGRVDLDRAIYLAMQLQGPEQRILAEIAACRPALEVTNQKGSSAKQEKGSPGPEMNEESP